MVNLNGLISKLYLGLQGSELDLSTILGLHGSESDLSTILGLLQGSESDLSCALSSGLQEYSSV
ncbi:hypothetical protein RRG08_005835 [Elysia crispata]|uniref:Uncharacterized protein n=1 Tax=Elysia crispata TaxID=231223 RepID=A0AAE1B4C8_9GAST|nr:hypothetical protein RRG08_005835 [Elysia crispata]